MLVMPTINTIDTYKNVTTVVISGMMDAAINPIKAHKSNFICCLSSLIDEKDLAACVTPCQRYKGLPVLRYDLKFYT